VGGAVGLCPDRAAAAAAPSPPEQSIMIAWPVSARVGSVKNNDPSLIEPIVLP